uniref:RNA2 polyprotein n=1 Tax=Ullucus comovirus 1 TaxID=2491949 RepID=A0A3G8FWQ9_9SECO|nr:orf1 [Ullucus comovirus 1]
MQQALKHFVCFRLLMSIGTGYWISFAVLICLAHWYTFDSTVAGLCASIINLILLLWTFYLTTLGYFDKEILLQRSFKYSANHLRQQCEDKARKILAMASSQSVQQVLSTIPPEVIRDRAHAYKHAQAQDVGTALPKASDLYQPKFSPFNYHNLFKTQKKEVVKGTPKTSHAGQIIQIEDRSLGNFAAGEAIVIDINFGQLSNAVKSHTSDPRLVVPSKADKDAPTHVHVGAIELIIESHASSECDLVGGGLLVDTYHVRPSNAVRAAFVSQFNGGLPTRVVFYPDTKMALSEDYNDRFKLVLSCPNSDIRAGFSLGHLKMNAIVKLINVCTQVSPTPFLITCGNEERASVSSYVDKVCMAVHAKAAKMQELPAVNLTYQSPHVLQEVGENSFLCKEGAKLTYKFDFGAKKDEPVVNSETAQPTRIQHVRPQQTPPPGKVLNNRELAQFYIDLVEAELAEEEALAAEALAQQAAIADTEVFQAGGGDDSSATVDNGADVISECQQDKVVVDEYEQGPIEHEHMKDNRIYMRTIPLSSNLDTSRPLFISTLGAMLDEAEPSGKLVVQSNVQTGRLLVRLSMRTSPQEGLGLLVTYNSGHAGPVSPIGSLTSESCYTWNPAFQAMCDFIIDPNPCGPMWNWNYISLSTATVQIHPLHNWVSAPTTSQALTLEVYLLKAPNIISIFPMQRAAKTLRLNKYIGVASFAQGSAQQTFAIPLDFGTVRREGLNAYSTITESYLSHWKYFRADVVVEFVKTSTPWIDGILCAAVCYAPDLSASQQWKTSLAKQQMVFGNNGRLVLKFTKANFPLAWATETLGDDNIATDGVPKIMLFTKGSVTAVVPNINMNIAVIVRRLENLECYGYNPGFEPGANSPNVSVQTRIKDREHWVDLMHVVRNSATARGNTSFILPLFTGIVLPFPTAAWEVKSKFSPANKILKLSAWRRGKMRVRMIMRGSQGITRANWQSVTTIQTRRSLNSRGLSDTTFVMAEALSWIYDYTICFQGQNFGFESNDNLYGGISSAWLNVAVTASEQVDSFIMQVDISEMEFAGNLANLVTFNA